MFLWNLEQSLFCEIQFGIPFTKDKIIVESSDTIVGFIYEVDKQFIDNFNNLKDKGKFDGLTRYIFSIKKNILSLKM